MKVILPHRLRFGGSRTRRSCSLAAALAMLVTVVLLTSATPAGATETTMFNISGRGWGHGIGMSQWGAYGYAKHGWTYKQILSHYYTGIAYGRVSNRQVRVLLNEGQPSVRVSAATPFKATCGAARVTIPGGTTASVAWSGSSYTLTAGAKSLPLPRRSCSLPAPLGSGSPTRICPGCRA